MQGQRHVMFIWLLALFMVLGVLFSSDHPTSPHSMEHFVSHHHFSFAGEDQGDDPDDNDSITIPLVPDAAGPLLVVGVPLLLMVLSMVRRGRFRKPDFLHLEVCPSPD